jgi:hypothetical protein
MNRMEEVKTSGWTGSAPHRHFYPRLSTLSEVYDFERNFEMLRMQR